ncbi:hypothetical protein BOTBODRAFT_176717 [Botryobasidium botryosum FD-172 SS1]|uniref:Uncharacterized protein n=1 Tax=Botryobasidium botryosum (strain FD-172 SS1) TaxID=930990 RepID=A0A067M9D6_BOTB1|nr:hypothetical protein BOTBODRAFT_176717 [Botryobasidium botryosum FD-172 SS1]
MDVIPETTPTSPASTTPSSYRQRWVPPQNVITNPQTRAGGLLATSLEFIKGAFQAAVEFSTKDEFSDPHVTMRNLFLGVLHVVDPDQLSTIIANEPDFLELIHSSGIPPPLHPPPYPAPARARSARPPSLPRPHPQSPSPEGQACLGR